MLFDINQHGAGCFVDGWLTAKVIALIAYIGLGMVALRHGSTKRLRVAAWIAAQVLFLERGGFACRKE